MGGPSKEKQVHGSAGPPAPIGGSGIGRTSSPAAACHSILTGRPIHQAGIDPATSIHRIAIKGDMQ
jgi:hypothetical protein